MTLTQDGLYCPGCGYDLRGLTSDRCPECGLVVNATRAVTIPWERRRDLGYFREFIRTLCAATLGPVKLARSTASPLDVRSARRFRWIVRAMMLVPCLGLFVLVALNAGGIEKLKVVDGESRAMDPLWEPQFIWQAGATLWPVLPIGFLLTTVLGTGISHWFGHRHRVPALNNRAMAFSYYLCAPLAWLFIPCVAIATMVGILSIKNTGEKTMEGPIGLTLMLTNFISILLILIAQLNSLRAVSVATGAGMIRSLLTGVGIVAQFPVSILLGVGLFPALIGLWRLAILSGRR